MLVVDDNADAAESLALLLGGRGTRSAPPTTARRRWRRPAVFRPDVVLLDIGLPGMDGYEVARRLRAAARVGEVVLVALTGYGQEEDRRRSREAGFDRHLVKPVDPEELFRLVVGVSRAGR